ncbi:hypothetical protein ABZ502_17135 [Streptomyces abikoensis]|uniref:hypothetical protein n=1 Tax=Streptomyces abikoensis TaxID=97398 RepID=UPI0033FD6C94
MTDAATLPFDPLLTILVLPGGQVHANGQLLTGPDPVTVLNQAWSMAHRAAASVHRAVQVNVGRPAGTVEAFLMSVDGSRIRLSAPPVLTPQETPDPRWSDDVLNHHPLVAPIRAAETAHDIHQARAAARHLADHLRRDLDPRHPYLVMANELQAHLALRANDWSAATRLYMAVAEARYLMRSPAPDLAFAVNNAVASWLAASAGPMDGQALADGYQLGHFLVRITPRRSEAITTVLRRLDPTPASGPSVVPK